MLLEDFFDFETVPSERIRLKGTRINLEHVLELYRGGMTPEQIFAYFGMWPPLEKIYAAITYYHSEREAVDGYLERHEAAVRQLREEYDRQPKSDVVKRLQAIQSERGRGVDTPALVGEHGRGVD